MFTICVSSTPSDVVLKIHLFTVEQSVGNTRDVKLNHMQYMRDKYEPTANIYTGWRHTRQAPKTRYFGECIESWRLFFSGAHHLIEMRMYKSLIEALIWHAWQ